MFHIYLPGALTGIWNMGDIIVSVNNRKTESIDEFLEQFRRSGRRIDILEVMRDSGIYELHLKSFDNVYD